MSVKTCIIIGGPTAVGKTRVAIEVAKHFGTQIISADSRQCYRELVIGVARPSSEELAAVPHHFIASHSIQEKVTAATFEQYALKKAEDIFKGQNTVVMVGGTGLYLRAFCEGFDAIPEVPESVQQVVRTGYAEDGLAWLQTEVERLDPGYYSMGEIKNPQRLMRALEVFLSTGHSILHFREGKKKERPFGVVKLALTLPREQLHQNINHRVEVMMQQGLLDEVKRLLPYQHLNALQTVGYRELFSYFEGTTSLNEAVAAIQQATRQYAKRQLTWFRKDEGYNWFHPQEGASIIRFIEDTLKLS